MLERVSKKKNPTSKQPGGKSKTKKKKRILFINKKTP